MLHSEEDYPESDDGFGPGSDLVLSVLGIVVLLIAISRVYAMFDVPLVKMAPAPTHEVTMRASVKQATDPAKTDPSSSETDPEGERAKIKGLNDAVDKYKQQLAWAMHQLNAKVPQTAVAFSLSGHDVSFFQKNSAILRPAAEQLIKGSVLSIGRIVLQNQANLLEIVGYASPEPPVNRNVVLSTERAFAVFQYLQQLGIPENCMSVVGVGRGRSELLYDAYLVKDKSRTVQSWDENFLSEKGEEFAAKIEDMLADERKVEIVATVDAKAKCTTEQLTHALGVD